MGLGVSPIHAATTAAAPTSMGGNTHDTDTVTPSTVHHRHTHATAHQRPQQPVSPVRVWTRRICCPWTNLSWCQSITWQRALVWQHHWIVIVMMALVTLFTLYADDIFAAVGDKSTDTAANVLFLICFIIFALELIIRSTIDGTYAGSFPFWVDICSTISLIPSSSYLSSSWLIPSSYSSQLYRATDISLIDAARALRIGSTGYTSSQYLHVLRLIRIIKLLVICAQPGARLLEEVNGTHKRRSHISSQASSAPGSPSVSRPNTPPPPSPRPVMPPSALAAARAAGHHASNGMLNGMNGSSSTEMVGLVPSSTGTASSAPTAGISASVWGGVVPSETPSTLRIHAPDEKRMINTTGSGSGSPVRHNASNMPPSPNALSSLSHQASDARLNSGGVVSSDKGGGEGRVAVVGNSIAMTLEMKIVLSVLFLIWLVPAIEKESLDHTPELTMSALEQSYVSSLANGDTISTNVVAFQSQFFPTAIYLRCYNHVYLNDTVAIDSLRNIEMLLVWSLSGNSVAYLDASSNVHDRAVYSMIRTTLIIAVLMFQSALFLRSVRGLLVRPLEEMVAFIGKHVNLDALKLRKRKPGARRRRHHGGGSGGGAGINGGGSGAYMTRATDEDTDGGGDEDDDDGDEENHDMMDDANDAAMRHRVAKRVLPGYNADGTTSIPGTPATGVSTLSTMPSLSTLPIDVNSSPNAPPRRLEMKEDHGHSSHGHVTGRDTSPRDKHVVIAGTASGRKKSSATKDADSYLSPSTVASPGRAVLKPRMAQDDEYGLVAVAFDAMLEANRAHSHQQASRKSKEKAPHGMNHGHNGGHGSHTHGGGSKRRSMVANIEAPIHRVLNTLKSLESSPGLAMTEIAQLKGLRKTLSSMGSRDDLFAPVLPPLIQQGSNSELQDWLYTEVGGGGQAQQHLRVLARRRPPVARRIPGNSFSMGSHRDLVTMSGLTPSNVNHALTPTTMGNMSGDNNNGPTIQPLARTASGSENDGRSGGAVSPTGRHQSTRSLPSPLRGLGPNAITASPNLHAIRWDLSRSTPSPLPTGDEDPSTAHLPAPLLQSSSTGALLASSTSPYGTTMGRRGSKTPAPTEQRRGSLGELGHRPSSRKFSGHMSTGNSSGDDSPAATPSIIPSLAAQLPSPGVTPLLATDTHAMTLSGSNTPSATTPSPLQTEMGAITPRAAVFQAALAAQSSTSSSSAATPSASSAPTTPALHQRGTSFSSTSWTSQPVSSGPPPPVPTPSNGSHPIISPASTGGRQFRERKSSLSRQDSARTPVTFAPDTRGGGSGDPITPTANTSSTTPSASSTTTAIPSSPATSSTASTPTTIVTISSSNHTTTGSLSPRSADLRVDTAAAAAADKEAREKRAADEKAKAVALMMSPKKKKSYSHLPVMAAHGGSFLLPALRLSSDSSLPSPLPSPQHSVGESQNGSAVTPANAANGNGTPVFSIPMPLALDQVIPREALVRASRARDMDDWNLDMFFINSTTMDHPLLYTSFVLFTKFGLFSIFNIEKQKFAAFILYMESQYQNNPYHNRIHAADVTLGSNFLVSQSDLLNQLEDWEILSLLLASIIHDVDHPGNSNKFEIKTSSHRALTYNDSSPLENHHLAVAWRALHQDQFNLLSGLSTEQYESVRSVVIELVLATDLKEHFKLVSTLKNAQRGVGQGAAAEGDGKLDSIVMMKTILKMADIGHSTKRQDLHTRWSAGITEEFFSQGDMELKRGLELSPFCDRRAPNVATSQIGFFDFIALPLYTAACPFFIPASQRRQSDDEPPATPTGDISTPSTPAHTTIDMDAPMNGSGGQGHGASSLQSPSGSSTAPTTPSATPAPTNVDKILEQALSNKAFWKAEAAKADAAKNEKKNTTPRGSMITPGTAGDKKGASPKSETTTTLAHSGNTPTGQHTSSLSSTSPSSASTSASSSSSMVTPVPAIGPAVSVGAAAVPAPLPTLIIPSSPSLAPANNGGNGNGNGHHHGTSVTMVSLDDHTPLPQALRVTSDTSSMLPVAPLFSPMGGASGGLFPSTPVPASPILPPGSSPTLWARHLTPNVSSSGTNSSNGGSTGITILSVPSTPLATPFVSPPQSVRGGHPNGGMVIQPNLGSRTTSIGSVSSLSSPSPSPSPIPTPHAHGHINTTASASSTGVGHSRGGSSGSGGSGQHNFRGVIGIPPLPLATISTPPASPPNGNGGTHSGRQPSTDSGSGSGRFRIVS